jgi:hypothetical protein
MKLQPELETHEQLEDAHLYGPLSHDAGKTDSKLAAWRKKHQHEVDKVDGLIEAMAALAPEGAPWLSKLKVVRASLDKHIREEEQDIFPRITMVWNEARLKRAGAAMKAKKLKPTTARRVA